MPTNFLAHYAADADMTPLDVLEPAEAVPWLHWATFLIRLTKSPAVTITALRGRAREDFDGDLAERYGYVNRAVPDAEFVEFVDAYARRVSRFDRRTLNDVKGFINAASLPDEIALMAEMRAFGEAIPREPAATLIPAAFAAGWGRPGEFELNIGARIADITTGS
jgi:enoyl-CoA hydratase/carnithine racemase